MEETAAPAAPETKPAAKVKPRWGRQAGVGKQKGTPNKVTVRMREIARALTLEDPVVLERLVKECQSGAIHPAIFIRFLEYGYGRVKYTVELEAPESPARTMAASMRLLSREEQMEMYRLTRKMLSGPEPGDVIEVKALKRGKRAQAKKSEAQVEAKPA